MNNNTLCRTLSAMSLCASLLLQGCEDSGSRKSTPTEQVAYEAAVQKYDHEAHNPVDQIALSDVALSRDASGMKVISGDTRPFFIAEGRVTNNLTHTNADRIAIRVYLIGSQNQVLDTADIVIQNIPPHGVRAFREVVQLLPPRSGQPFMNFNVESVDTSPVKRP